MTSTPTLPDGLRQRSSSSVIAAPDEAPAVAAYDTERRFMDGRRAAEVEEQIVIDVTEALTPPAPPPPAERRRSVTQRLMDVGATVFEVLTVAINLLDVASDVLVAVQFYRDGDTVWFALVVTFLMVAHLAYTIIATWVLNEQSHWRDVHWDQPPWWVRFLVSFVLIAQFVPVLNLVFEKERLRRRDPTAAPDEVEEVEAGGLTQAAREELERVREARLIHTRMQRAMEAHFQRFGLFYVESGVEAAPQAIIQLLAITFLGRASWVQLVSLCCSLFSITSKGFIISGAFDLRVMVFKFATVAHDVFSTFYLFSTLIAVETPKHTTFWGQPVSWLGYIWLCNTTACFTIGWLSGVMTYVGMLYDDAGVCNAHRIASLRQCRGITAAYMFSQLVAGPILLAFVAVKLAWFTVSLIVVVEPHSRHFPMFALITSFLSRDDRHNNRLRFIYTSIYSAGTRARPTMRRALPIQDSSHTALSLQVAAASNPASTFDLWHAYRAHGDHVTIASRLLTLRPGQKAVAISAACCVPVAAWSQVFALFYPIANVALGGQHNLLQATCLGATAVAAGVVLATTPSTITYALICRVFQPLCNRYEASVEEIARSIAEFHEPPHIGALQTIVSPAVVPLDVVAVIAAYLTPRDLGLDKLSAAQCEALKATVAATYGAETAKPCAEDRAVPCAPQALPISSPSERVAQMLVEMEGLQNVEMMK